MRTNAIKLSFIAIAAIGIALTVVAIAVAQPGDGDSGGEGVDTPTVSVPSASPASDATDQPTAGSPTGTDVPAPPTGDPLPTDSPDEDGQASGERGEVEGAESIEGTTPALNPGGHCVELPNDSDVVLNPDKHPNWTVGGCEPGEIETPDGGDPPNENGGPPAGRTPAVNPDGVCIDLPNNSDIVKNPEKHPNWTVGGCQLD